MAGTDRKKRGQGKREDRRKLRRYEEEAFLSLVRKFQNIRYLAEQKAMIDVIEKTPVAICITNERHLYEYVNPAYCRLYGYEFDELIGESFLLVVPEEYRTEMVSLHDQFMNHEYELEGEWQVVTKTGEERTILANAAYVVDETGNPKKVTFVLDITERKRAAGTVEGLQATISRIGVGLRDLSETIEDLDPESIRVALREFADRCDAARGRPSEEDPSP